MAETDRPETATVPLPGSDRTAAPSARAAGALEPDERITVTLVLRRREPLPPDAPRMSTAELADSYGADPADLDLVSGVLAPYGITLVEADLGTRHVRVEGTVGDLERVFGTALERVESTAPDGRSVTHRQRTGALSVPAELADAITAVLGLDDRPQARTQYRVAGPRAAGTAYTPVELGAVYRFPADADGSGTTIGIIELGGGYRESDLTEYFGALGVGSPSVRAVAVDGGKNAPTGDPDGPDGEVLLDIEVVGALAPGADVVVYFAPNTDAGFVDAVARAAHASPTPAAISISWGQSEDQWTAQSRQAFDEALQDAVALGVVVTVAAGDNGSADGESDGGSHVDFPASSPHALACGGTSLSATGTAVRSETVWNDGSNGGATGGGVSRYFPLPTWQAGAGVPAGVEGGGRGVPDVAGDADPETGYRVRIDGTDTVIGGTSAVAPLWAALVARLVQSTGSRIGPLQPSIYAATTGFRDITSGNNGAFRAATGWDACTGLGVPDGEALLGALRG